MAAMKNNKTSNARKFAVNDVKSGFVSSTACCVIIMLFGIALVFFGGRPGVDVQLLGFAGIAAGAVILIYGIFTMHLRNKRVFRYMQEYSFCMDTVTRTALENFVHPMAVINDEGEIIWSNNHFLKMIDRESHYGEYIQDIFPNLPVGKYIESASEVKEDFEYKDRSYIVRGRAIVNTSDSIKLAGLYFVDVTEMVGLRQTVEDNRTVECIAVVDNYDEVIKETPNSNHGALMGEIERCVNAWVARGKGTIRKYEREKFLIFFRNKEYTEVIEKEKYKVLNEVRSINLENKIPVTLSIGTGIGGETLEDNDKMAALALEMALGRGGDQVVVKSPSSYKFYGAKSREVEKSTKVKARVVAHAMRQLIDQSSKVIIMGHRDSDMDCFGAAIGLYQAIRSRGVDAYIAVRRSSSNAKMLLNIFSEIPEYSNNIITGDKAVSIADKQTLLIVVDTHRRSMVEFEELLGSVKSIVLIDHHRRSEDLSTARY